MAARTGASAGRNFLLKRCGPHVTSMVRTMQGVCIMHTHKYYAGQGGSGLPWSGNSDFYVHVATRA